MDELFIKPEKDSEEKTPPTSYTFKLLLKSRPSHNFTLLSSPSTSHIGLSGFSESSKLGSITCWKTSNGVKTNLMISTLYSANNVLYINTNEKLRPEFSIEFTEFLIKEGLFQGTVTVLDSVCKSDYLGSQESNIRFLHSKTAGYRNDLQPGNSVKGVVAAVLLAAEVHGFQAVVALAVLESYELCVENSNVFEQVFNGLGLDVNWISGINRFEQERFKHQIYS
jgi:hypothetical protein